MAALPVRLRPRERAACCGLGALCVMVTSPPQSWVRELDLQGGLPGGVWQAAPPPGGLHGREVLRTPQNRPSSR